MIEIIENTEKWIELFESIGFEEKDFDKIIEYVKTHIEYEQNNPILFNDEIPYSTLVMALQVLKQIVLNNIHFQSQAVTGGKNVVATTSHEMVFRFDNESLMCVSDIEAYMAHEFINEIVTVFEEKLKTEELHIYVLFNDIKIKDYVCSVFHKFTTKVLLK